MQGELAIQVEILLPGTNIDNLTNFWWMVQRCFYPGGGQNDSIQTALVSIGARSGIVRFSQPAFDPSPDGVWLAGQGQIMIAIRYGLL